MSELLPARIAEILGAANRLYAVRQTELVGKDPELRFDGLSSTAAIIFNAPVAQVTLLKKDQQWMLSSQGFDIKESATETSFCAHALTETSQTMVVLDAANDERFKENPFVVNPPHIRFYAGCPIMAFGQNVGTVCVYDFEPRDGISNEQNQALIDLAKEAAEMIESDRNR